MLFGECIAKCSYPLAEERGVLVTEYSDPALEGDSITSNTPSAAEIGGVLVRD